MRGSGGASPLAQWGRCLMAGRLWRAIGGWPCGATPEMIELARYPPRWILERENELSICGPIAISLAPFLLAAPL
jgi:hypothetical protein